MNYGQISGQVGGERKREKEREQSKKKCTVAATRFFLLLQKRGKKEEKKNDFVMPTNAFVSVRCRSNVFKATIATYYTTILFLLAYSASYSWLGYNSILESPSQSLVAQPFRGRRLRLIWYFSISDDSKRLRTLISYTMYSNPKNLFYFDEADLGKTQQQQQQHLLYAWP